jgi:hypothetical protein
LEGLIGFLRSSGCSKIDSIAILARECGIGLARAKEVVHFSRAWNDTREADESFHADIERAVVDAENTRRA